MARRHAPKGRRPSLAFVDVLARRARSGDASATRELLERAIAPIAEATSAKYAAGEIRKLSASRGLERDDFRQEAVLAMLSGLASWDPTRCAFRTHAFALARYACLNLLNSGTLVFANRQLVSAAASGQKPPAMRQGSWEALLAASSGHVARLADNPHDEEEGEEAYAAVAVGQAERGYEEAMARLELGLVLKRSGSGLTDRERETLVAKHVYGERLTEVAKAAGVTRQAAANWEARGLRKLRYGAA